MQSRLIILFSSLTISACAQKSVDQTQLLKSRVTELNHNLSGKNFGNIYDMFLPNIRKDIGERDEYIKRLEEGFANTKIMYEPKSVRVVNKKLAVSQSMMTAKFKSEPEFTECLLSGWIWYDDNWYLWSASMICEAEEEFIQGMYKWKDISEGDVFYKKIWRAIGEGFARAFGYDRPR